jgi:putative hemolysin
LELSEDGWIFGDKIMQLAYEIAERIQAAVHLGHLPRIEVDDGRYEVRLAHTSEEIDAALKLRFEVFNLELDEGLASSFQTGRDRDDFDATCDHLIATDKTNGKVIGTYRLRTMEMARSVEGFYSSAEFDLNQLAPAVLNQSVELGRACIAQSHRNRQVLFLLWKALAQYVTNKRKRFLFGCCSLTSQEPAEGNQLFNQLRNNDHMHPTTFVAVKPGYECSGKATEKAWPTEVKVPRLFSTYLGIGAKVCSPPAIDRRFKTIDFLVMFDVQRMNSRTHRLFFSV